jgi:hypothetical protein
MPLGFKSSHQPVIRKISKQKHVRQARAARDSTGAA